MALSTTTIALLVGVVLLAGALNGVAGFGFALVGTTALATALEPATAVVIMIVPILSVNLALVSELDADTLRSCGTRFAPLLGAALVGTIVGMIALEQLPAAPLRIGLGVLSLLFVATAQNVVALPGRESVEERCFVESPLAMVGVGGISGLLFGGTNVGVQLIAYLRSCDLSHGLFVGVVAMVFLGLNGVRVVAAGALGLYPSQAIALASLGAVVPAVAGVAVGKRLRSRVGQRERRFVVLALLTAVGVRLVAAGFGI